VLEGWLAQWRGSVDWSGSARSAAYGLTAYRLIQKARSGFSGAGLICDDEDMPVSCPTCQNGVAGSLKRPDAATLHGVVLDILIERPIHGSETMPGRSDSVQAARRAQQRGALRRRAKMGG
jgi:hypothetical protein